VCVDLARAAAGVCGILGPVKIAAADRDRSGSLYAKVQQRAAFTPPRPANRIRWNQNIAPTGMMEQGVSEMLV
jgi:hypothetical protein